MTSSVPPGEVEAARPSDGVVPAGPQEHPAIGRSVPEEQKDIPPRAGVPVNPGMVIPEQDKDVTPGKNKVKFPTLFNRMCIHHGLPERQIDVTPPELKEQFRTCTKETLIKAVAYMEANHEFRNRSWSIKTLAKNAVRYAQLWDEFYGPQAKTKTTASGPQDAPKNAGKPKTAQVIPEDLAPAWERLQTIVVPVTKRHKADDWKKLQAKVTPKDTADAIIDRYTIWVEAWRATKESEEKEGRCPCFR